MGKKAVLLVDEDAATREIIREVLEHHGYGVSEASTGPEGLERAIAETPDLIIVAFPVRMPDDRTLTETLRSGEVKRADRGNGAAPDLRSIPILGVTAETAPWDVEQASAAGCDALCTKPIDPRLVVIQIRDMIGPSVEN